MQTQKTTNFRTNATYEFKRVTRPTSYRQAMVITLMVFLLIAGAFSAMAQEAQWRTHEPNPTSYFEATDTLKLDLANRYILISQDPIELEIATPCSHAELAADFGVDAFFLKLFMQFYGFEAKEKYRQGDIIGIPERTLQWYGR